MPLPPAAPRQAIHARDLICRGYRREDGLWDIEGQLSDTKTYGFHTEEKGTIAAGDRIHGMWLRLTVDDHFTVHGVEAVTDNSPYLNCAHVVDRYKQLVGLSIGPGWTRAVKERLSGVFGCTHLTELLGPLATVAFQTIYPLLAKEKREREQAMLAAGETPPVSTERPALLNMCHIFASDGEVTRRHWPDYYTGPQETGAPDPDPVLTD